MATCNCQTEVTEKLLENFKDKFPEAFLHKVNLTSYSLFINGTTGQCGSAYVVYYEAEAEYPLKKGGLKRKKLKGSIVANYCPFCGISTKEKGNG